MSGTYSFSEDELDGELNFTFGNDKATYLVNFNPNEHSKYIEAYPLLLNRYFSLNVFRFAHHDGVRFSRDDRVKATIIRILSVFWESADPETILLYTCDNRDHKQTGRSKIFRSWHEEYRAENPNSIFKIEIPIQQLNEQGEVVRMRYLGMITRCNNPNLQEITKEFQAFTAQLVIEDK